MSPNLKRDRTGERARQAERKMAAYLKRMADRLAVFEAQAAAVYPFDDAAIGAAAEKEAAGIVREAIEWVDRRRIALGMPEIFRPNLNKNQRRKLEVYALLLSQRLVSPGAQILLQDIEEDEDIEGLLLPSLVLAQVTRILASKAEARKSEETRT